MMLVSYKQDNCHQDKHHQCILERCLAYREWISKLTAFSGSYIVYMYKMVSNISLWMKPIQMTAIVQYMLVLKVVFHYFLK